VSAACTRLGAWRRRGVQRSLALVLVTVTVVSAQSVETPSDALAAASLARATSPAGASSYRPEAAPGRTALPSAAIGFRRADGVKLGILAGAALLLTTVDARGDAWARRPAIQSNSTLRSLSKIGDATGTYVALSVGPASWLLGRARNDSGVALLGLRTTEAAVLSTATVGAIKLLAGRSRPYASADHRPTHWNLLGGFRSDSTRSFVSGHSALSAAAAVTLAAEWRRQGSAGWKTVGPPLVYALASLTAASRVRDRQHWLSDVAAGSAVGMASALLVRRWHDTHPGSRIDRVLLRR
jgi:membrane-associated phospholipid phosphatase